MEFEMGLRVLGVGFRESLLEKRDRLRLDLRWIDKSGERREEAGEARCFLGGAEIGNGISMLLISLEEKQWFALLVRGNLQVSQTMVEVHFIPTMVPSDNSMRRDQLVGRDQKQRSHLDGEHLNDYGA
ncbi:hypothetical protein MRB53_012818 [Persea americana]|uniref:Uncharacterized protein n=1 Tax=Persea americana TaxID=3435 RepID=A0ACC2LYV9_PERAE|nr:hypothetical protein MRB53_012818 [Persea americana]